jgi:hypothetical protein
MSGTDGAARRFIGAANLAAAVAARQSRQFQLFMVQCGRLADDTLSDPSDAVLVGAGMT